MSKSQAIAFFEEISKNQQLAKEVEKVIGGKNSHEAKSIKLISLANKHGFNFTKEEASSAQGAFKTSLSPEELLEVSGGKLNLKSSIMAMALLTGLSVVGATMSNMEASAMETEVIQNVPPYMRDVLQESYRFQPPRPPEDRGEKARKQRVMMKLAKKLAKATGFCDKDKAMLKELYSRFRKHTINSTSDIYAFLGGEERDSGNPYTKANKSDIDQILKNFRSIGDQYKVLSQGDGSFPYMYFRPEQNLNIGGNKYRITVNTKTQADTLKILNKLVDTFRNRQDISNYIFAFKGLVSKPSSTDLDCGLFKFDKVVIYFYDDETANIKQELLKLINDSDAEITPSMSAFYQTGLYEDKGAASFYNHGIGFASECCGRLSFTQIRAKIIENVLKNMSHQQNEKDFINNVKLEFLNNGIDPQTPHLQG